MKKSLIVLKKINGFALRLTLKKRLWANRKGSLESVGEILWCWYSNETYLVKRLQGTIYFLRFYQTKFNFGGILLARRLEVKRFLKYGKSIPRPRQEWALGVSRL